MTPTPTPPPQAASAAMPTPPIFPSGEEIYNTLMGAIEPELTTEQIPLLAEKYKEEAPEQRTARMDRYQKAFAAYDKKFAEHLLSMESAARSYQNGLVRYIEQMDAQAGDQVLANIENSLSLL